METNVPHFGAPSQHTEFGKSQSGSDTKTMFRRKIVGEAGASLASVPHAVRGVSVQDFQHICHLLRICRKLTKCLLYMFHEQRILDACHERGICQ